MLAGWCPPKEQVSTEQRSEQPNCDSREREREREKMNTDITASAKPEYPVIDRNPPFTKVVGNFSTLDYFRFATITGVSVTVGYLSGNPFSPFSQFPFFFSLLGFGVHDLGFGFCGVLIQGLSRELKAHPWSLVDSLD